MSQKIAVFGTGANGSCIAASLIDAGLDVVLIDQWPAHVEAMRAKGLTIAMPESRAARGGARLSSVRPLHLERDVRRRAARDESL